MKNLLLLFTLLYVGPALADDSTSFIAKQIETLVPKGSESADHCIQSARGQEHFGETNSFFLQFTVLNGGVPARRDILLPSDDTNQSGELDQEIQAIEDSPAYHDRFCMYQQNPFRSGFAVPYYNPFTDSVDNAGAIR